MKSNFDADGETRLDQQLRDEARATRPEFSAELHERICAAITAQPANVYAWTARAEPSPPLRLRLTWIVAAVAVAVAVLVPLAIVWMRGRSPDAPVQLAGPAPVAPPPAPHDPVEELDGVATFAQVAADHVGDLLAAAPGDTWDELCDDAETALQSLVDQLRLDVPISLASAESPAAGADGR